MRVIMNDLNNLAHAEDPSRYTVQATDYDVANNWASDLIAWNYYPGWYNGNTMKSKLDEFPAAARPSGISEYGAGGSIYQHKINPARPVPGGNWHPEEYQSKAHENAIRDIAACDFVWGTFLWNMFDFASDYRAEGDQHGINDKGLVTYDRKVKKDSYYAYKVNWNVTPEVYIASRRYHVREEESTPVVVYSNCDRVELSINGKSAGKIFRADASHGFFKWENVTLEAGENDIVAKGISGDREYTDEVQWTRELPNHLAIKKSVTSDSEEDANPAVNAVDGDPATRWAARDGNVHWIEVDLEKEYTLNLVKIQWYEPNASRYYKYTISVEDENKNQVTVVDRTNNTQGGIVSDDMDNVTGRYVRVHVSGSSGGFPSIHEIEVYGEAMSSTSSSREDNRLRRILNITDKHEIVFISLIDPAYTVKLEITDVAGKRVFYRNITEDISLPLPGGVYLFRYYSDNSGLVTEKVLVK
jgi:hypothetical protein